MLEEMKDYEIKLYTTRHFNLYVMTNTRGYCKFLLQGRGDDIYCIRNIFTSYGRYQSYEYCLKDIENILGDAIVIYVSQEVEAIHNLVEAKTISPNYEKDLLDELYNKINSAYDYHISEDFLKLMKKTKKIIYHRRWN